MKPRQHRSRIEPAADRTAPPTPGRGGERPARKRIATIGAVYDAEPAPKRPHDIITLAAAGKKKHQKNCAPAAYRLSPIAYWIFA